MSWKPISTFAQDCVDPDAILIFVPGVGIQQAIPEDGGFRTFSLGTIGAEPGMIEGPVGWLVTGPTHWMPLPQLPAFDGADAELPVKLVVDNRSRIA